MTTTACAPSTRPSPPSAAEEAQLVGGEPTLHPAFTSIAQHALDAGLRARGYSDLVRIRDEHRRLLEQPGVRLATTYHSSVTAEHDAVTGRPGSHRATRGNIVQALRRGVPLKVAVLDGGDEVRAELACAELKSLGVRDVHVGRVRPSATPRVPRYRPPLNCADGAGTRGPRSSRAGK
ncbi:radical SAM protein [Streptomyces sp. SID685]|uniref:radical SAM protein n=1 Tax=Streptomyces sp. SID685 TaxID=2690322 RepID=UPI001F27003E|nr:radical SAM protein [Streptomyces sp. SID685]